MSARVALLAAIVLALGACNALAGLDVSYELADDPLVTDGGAEDGSSTGGDGSGSGSGNDAAGPADAEPQLDASSQVDAGRDAEVDAGHDAGSTCGAGTCQSCAELLASEGELGSGVYTIAGASGPLSVYCDMLTAGGGWTLVGRSAGTVATPFGWRVQQGSVEDDDHPYSLDATKLAFAPTEILFGERGAGKSWGPRVYRAQLPPNFLVAHQVSATELMERATVSGTCTGGGGAMQRYVGYTARIDVFFFRDNDQPESFGLEPTGWDGNGSGSCTYSGELDSRAGMIFVR